MQVIQGLQAPIMVGAFELPWEVVCEDDTELTASDEEETLDDGTTTALELSIELCSDEEDTMLEEDSAEMVLLLSSMRLLDELVLELELGSDPPELPPHPNNRIVIIVSVKARNLATISTPVIN